MVQLLNTLLLPLLASLATSVVTASAQDLRITNLKRKWDLESSTPRELISLSLQLSKGSSREQVNSFVWSLPRELATLYLSDFGVSFKDEESAAGKDDSNDDDSSSSSTGNGKVAGERPIEIPCNTESVSGDAWPRELASQSTCFKVNLNKKLTPGSKVIAYLQLTYLPFAVPYPYQVLQNSNQYLKASVPVTTLSQYPVEKQSTSVFLASSNVKNVEGNVPVQHDKKGRKVSWIVSESIAPFTYHTATLTYEFNQPYMLIRSLNRTIYISHWADDILVEDSYDLRHEGARLKKPYSRIEHKMSPYRGSKTGGMVSNLPIPIPTDSSAISFVDEVGNVSTSNIIYNSGKILLLQPRYPLFGGWNYTWTHSFHIPLSNYLFRSAKEDCYTLKGLALAGLFNKVSVERLRVTVVFPQGARNPQLNVPFPTDPDNDLIQQVIYTYLDTAGRTSITLLKDKVTEPMVSASDFTISYDYSVSDMMVKVIVVIVAFFTIFLFFIVWARLDFSITDPKAVDAGKKNK